MRAGRRGGWRADSIWVAARAPERLSLAAKVDRVIGTDINPRAVALSRINAALNGIGNVEFREGDMFAPVAGETFDLIISQPPFVSTPPGPRRRRL